MKKMLILVVVGVLVLSGLVGAADQPKSDQTSSIRSKNISFSTPVLEEKDGYLTVKLDGTDKQIMETGKPMLPRYVTSFTFSGNAKIEGVTCTFSDVNEISIDKKIAPAPEPVLLTNTIVKESTVEENSEVYESNEIFPDNWYNYIITCGLNSMDQPSIFVTVTVYPVRYSPASNKLQYVNDVDIKITYDDPGYQPTNTLEEYDMVIIAPNKFSSALQPLITHKESYGVKTILKTTESIYDEYSGRDKPEQIKYFIKYARETWNITYVLLAGGLNSYINAKDRDDCNQGSTDWWVPVRYTNIPLDDGHGCISDLYYGDLYRYNTTTNTTEFEDWDSNGNDIFAEWSGMKKDKLDLVPDVYYGRLACVNTYEVKLVVDKIINYEKTSTADKTWLKTMIGIGGKTFDFYMGQPDGEYLCDLSTSYMGSLIDNPVTVYASNNDTGGFVPLPDDIVEAISGGAGYVNFEGHGNPRVWSTHWADNSGGPGSWADGIASSDFRKFTNGDKLPVVIIGGCHNALFNVTLIKTLFSGNVIFTNIPILKNLITPGHWYWTYGVPIPRCFSWWLLTLKKGGAIASTGCTGYGIGYQGQPVSLSAEMEVDFFYQIGQNGSTTLGSAHSGSIRKYISDEGIPTDTDAHCLTVYQLFGDPSLKLGGY